jgi:ABC-2 type transport system ATP-binding protein
MANQPKQIISVENFVMKFGKTTIINGLSFAVNEGETFGLLGSNGSGKTTIIRTLLGAYAPSGGALLIDSKPYDVGGG